MVYDLNRLNDTDFYSWRFDAPFYTKNSNIFPSWHWTPTSLLAINISEKVLSPYFG
jgi:hypothetical protein